MGILPDPAIILQGFYISSIIIAAMLSPDFIELVCDPHTFEPLKEQEGQLVSRKAVYPICEGIPVFLKAGELSGDNEKYQKFYDKVGFFTRSVFWTFCRLFRLDTVSVRKDLLSDLPVKAGDKVLETSIGAGANIPPLDPKGFYVGVDISMGMLKACQRYPLLKDYQLQLVQANAEYLPFKDNSFDVVFHFGGINFFNDKKRAIAEMIRVAKPGAMLLIGDETQEHVDSWYKKVPFVKNYFKDVEPVAPPTDLIPKNMLNIKTSYKWEKSMYIITFKKPV